MPEDNDLLDLLPSDKSAEELEAERKAKEEQDNDHDVAEAAHQEFERLKAEAARMRPFHDIASELEANPSKYLAVRAALEGRFPGAAETQPQPQYQPQLTEEQKQRLNEEFQLRPAEMTAAAAQLVARQEQEAFYRKMVPVIEAAGEGLVESFRAKKSKDPLYDQVSEQFEKEMGDVNREALLRAPAKIRQREMDLRWNAAKAKVLDEAMLEAAKKVHDRPRAMGGGGGSTPSPLKTKLDSNPDLVRLARATGAISREDLEAILSVASDYQE
jgi:hypothetical protein